MATYRQTAQLYSVLVFDLFLSVLQKHVQNSTVQSKGGQQLVLGRQDGVTSK